MRKIIAINETYKESALELVETVFTEYSDAQEGKYENELLILAPVAVKTDLQRQHISKDLIEYGFECAKKMGYKAVLVEGNPQNYRARGFATSADYGIVAGESVHLPAIECLMVKELVNGALDNMAGTVEYYDYEFLV